MIGENLEQNGVFVLSSEIDEAVAKSVIEWILDENLSKQRKKSLTLVISSGGGEMDSAFAIVDCMLGSGIPVYTIGLGLIASSAFMIFIAGKKGHRILTPNTMVMSHQYSWQIDGKAHELLTTVKAVNLMDARILNHYRQCTGLSKKEIQSKLLAKEDSWLSPNECVDLKCCDKVVSTLY